MIPTQEGSWMVNAAARLGLPQGESYSRGYAFLPLWILYSLAFGLLNVGIWALARNRLENLRAWGMRSLDGWRDLLGLIILCICVVAVFDGSGMVHGFFRQDDFSFLEVARENNRLWQQMALYHNDHFCPLFRLEVWSILKLAGEGASAHALAIYFNAMNFLACAGLLLSGCWLLHELGASRLTVLVFAFLLWTWPGWGEFTAGYYTLSIFTQIQGLAFCAAAAMSRGFRRHSTAWLACSLILAATALAMNISGMSSFVSVFLIGVAWQDRETTNHRVPYLIALLGVLIVASALYVLVIKHPYSARELVQNPAGQSAGLTMLGNLYQNPIGVLRASFSAMGGLLLNLFSPTFLQVKTGKVINTPVLRECLILVELIVVALAVRFVVRRLGRIARSDRWLILAVVGCAVVCLGMVIVARTTYAVEVPATFWYAKYIIAPACWLWLAIALFADRLWLSPSRPGAEPFAGLLTTLAIGAWLTVSFWQWERTMIPGALAYTPRGRWGNVINAEARADDYNAVLMDLVAISVYTGSSTVRLPEPSIWSGEFYRLHGVLEWGSDTASNGVTYLFWDLLAASPGLHMQGRWESETALTPALRNYLGQYPWLRPVRSPDVQYSKAAVPSPNPP
jgi:hypothetical protein